MAVHIAYKSHHYGYSYLQPITNVLLPTGSRKRATLYQSCNKHKTGLYRIYYLLMTLFSRISQSILPPEESDPEQQRIANALGIFLSTVVFFHTAYQVAGFFNAETMRLTIVSLFGTALVTPLYLTSIYFYRKRIYDHASRLTIAGLWLSVTYNIFIRGSVLMQIYDLYYLLILLAGYLLTQRAAIFLVILTYLTTFFLWWGESVFIIGTHNYPKAAFMVIMMKCLMLSIMGLFIIRTTEHIRLLFSNLQEAAVGIKKSEVQLAKANNSLKTQSDLMQTIIDNLPGRITYIDSNLHTGFTSRGFTEIGLGTDNSIGSLITKTIDEEHIKLLTSSTQTPFSDNSARWEKPFTSNGETRIINTSYIPHLVDDQIKGIISLARDVTIEQKTQEAVWQSQKLSSLGLLAGGVAHDFNNLLTAIMGHSSLATLKMQNQHPSFNHITKAIDASERAADLTRQMLAYSGGGHFEIQKLNINKLIYTNIQLFQVSVPKSVEVKTQFISRIPLIKADEGQIQQVIMNLILNAVQAIGEEQGIIEIITSIRKVNANELAYRQYTGEVLSAGHYLVISIQDNGCGMDQEMVGKIFDPFFTSKASGSGLGLAAVLGIIRGHEGSLQVFSKPSVGTTFEVLLPIIDINEIATIEDLVLEKNHNAIEKGASRPTGSILIIDDEAVVCNVTSDILSIEGWHTYTAYSGRTGLDIYQQHQEQIQLILLDLSMPDMNGKETLLRLRQINPAALIVLTSGYDKSKALLDFDSKQLTGFIQKPCPANKLIRLIEQYSHY